MPASDHISPQLFHGTSHYFGEGEMIEPKSIGASYEAGLKTFASPSMDVAKEAAGHRAYRESMLFAPVYEVEPTGPTEQVNNTIVSSSHSLKPKKIAGWGVNPSIVVK